MDELTILVNCFFYNYICTQVSQFLISIHCRSELFFFLKLVIPILISCLIFFMNKMIKSSRANIFFC